MYKRVPYRIIYFLQENYANQIYQNIEDKLQTSIKMMVFK